MAVAAGVVGLPRQAAVIAVFEVAAERRRAAGLDGDHDLGLDAPEMTPMDLTISRAVTAEHIRIQLRRSWPNTFQSGPYVARTQIRSGPRT
jgi:hypothetical protein